MTVERGGKGWLSVPPPKKPAPDLGGNADPGTYEAPAGYNVTDLDPRRSPNLRCPNCGGEWWTYSATLATIDNDGPAGFVFDVEQHRIVGFTPGAVVCLSCDTLSEIPAYTR